MASNKADQQKISKPTLPALPKFHAIDTDSQPDQHPVDAPPPQINLMSKLQSVLEADDEDEADTGFEDLQVALQRVIKSKAAKQQQKQQAILQELQASIAAQVR